MLTKLISATLALSLLGGSAAMAQPNFNNHNRSDNRGGNLNHDGNRGGGPGRGGDGDRRGGPGGGDRGGWDHDRGGGDRDRDRGGFSFGFGYGPGYGYAPGYGYGYGPSYRYDWRVGQRFSPYGAHYIVVNDWYRYHLRRPPIGYHWVRVNNDFLLVGIASGIIADLLLNQYNYY